MQTAATKAALTAMLAINPFLFFANPPLWILGLTAPEFRGMRRLPVRPSVQPEAMATVPAEVAASADAVQVGGLNTPTEAVQRSHGTRKRTTVRRSSSGTPVRSNSRRRNVIAVVQLPATGPELTAGGAR